MQKLNEEKRQLLFNLRRAWESSPDKRFGEMLVTASQKIEFMGRDVHDHTVNADLVLYKVQNEDKSL